MPERQIGPEFIELWDGHQPKDDCPIIPFVGNPLDILKLPYIFPRVLGEVYGDMIRRDRILLAELREFIAIQPTAPLKRITEGQKFDPSEYQPKTILTIRRKRSFGDDTFEQGTWAITSLEWQPDGSTKNVIVGFSVAMILSGLRFLEMGNRDWYESFTVGNVIHEKEKYFPFRQHDTFTRYGTVEIWKFGLADPAKNPSVSPSLKPVTQRS